MKSAAAKGHLRLNRQSFFPQRAIVDSSYTKLVHLFELTERGIWRLGRVKDNMPHTVVRASTWRRWHFDVLLKILTDSQTTWVHVRRPESGVSAGLGLNAVGPPYA